MMEYVFDETLFCETFNVKDDKSMDSLRLTHVADKHFKLFPYKASGKTQAPIVFNLEDVISGFFRRALNIETETVSFENLCENIMDELDIEEEDKNLFCDMIEDLFFEDGNFIARNFGLYPYQTVVNNKSADRLAQFFFNVFGLDELDCELIETYKDNYSFNVLEKLLVDAIKAKKIEEDREKPYFCVIDSIKEKFKEDFYFMLKTGMTSLEDFANLFSVYYLFYISQACISLDRFCEGDRNENVKLFYALDWEKVSKNRQCCVQGWDKLQGNINHMFSHAITLEIINQTRSDEMIDYISFREKYKPYSTDDLKAAMEIKKAERLYRNCVGDYTSKFDEIKEVEGISASDKALRHLFKCVEAQFLNTDRKRANQFYNEKFSEFCKYRWVKNRKKSGLVLNLTERDIIFLTKISLKERDKMRLIDLYKEYEIRGINLDNTSKEYLQAFFTKLNLIDKKSDSGDAQYVKRIL